MKSHFAIPFIKHGLGATILIACAFSHGLASEPEPVYEATSVPIEDQVPIRLARVSFVEGPVNSLRIHEDDWSAAEINLPLVAGDQLFSGIGAKAEIQLEDDVVVWLGEDTFVTFRALDDELIHLEILKGSVTVKAREIEYPRPPMHLTGPGLIVTTQEFASLRINVSPEGPSDVLIDRGDALVTVGEDDPIRIQRGQRLAFNPTAMPPELQVTDMTPDDDFDRWCDMRDAMAATVVSREYISTRVSGYRDLDQHGDWVEVEEYGRVWTPRVTVVDWAPYRDGRWIWREPFGWTWISYEPWGWVPYHYGRWVHTSSYNWCWVPTDVVHVVHAPIRPVWCPALVSFTYASSSSYFSFSIGHSWDAAVIGWFPLGPYDYYHPWYHVGVHYVHRGHHYPPRYHHPYGPSPWGPGHPHAPNYDRYPYHPKGNYSSNNQYAANQNSNNAINVNPVINNNITIQNYQNANVKNAVTVVPRQDFEGGRYERRTAASIVDRNQNELAVGDQASRALPRAVRGAGRSASAQQGQGLDNLVSNDRAAVRSGAGQSPADAIGRGNGRAEGGRLSAAQAGQPTAQGLESGAVTEAPSQARAATAPRATAPTTGRDAAASGRTSAARVGQPTAPSADTGAVTQAPGQARAATAPRAAAPTTGRDAAASGRTSAARVGQPTAPSADTGAVTQAPGQARAATAPRAAAPTTGRDAAATGRVTSSTRAGQGAVAFPTTESLRQRSSARSATAAGTRSTASASGRTSTAPTVRGNSAAPTPDLDRARSAISSRSNTPATAWPTRSSVRSAAPSSSTRATPTARSSSSWPEVQRTPSSVRQATPSARSTTGLPSTRSGITGRQPTTSSRSTPSLSTNRPSTSSGTTSRMTPSVRTPTRSTTSPNSARITRTPSPSTNTRS
ncbi:MAG: hypothetical protein PHF14_14730, partial [Verrucomicrobiota bacterium]|nr:hypothetical protein [Verrucomicrobiota bacterium]